MIDPTKISNFHLTINELEENICFWVAVANKTAATISQYVDNFFLDLSKQVASTFDPNLASPFQLIREAGSIEQITDLVKKHRFGCFKNKARGYHELAYSGINLKMCTVDDLEKIHGIGPKTARCFLIHTRENARHAGLDTHVLKFMRAVGLDAPKSTPTGKQYKYWEEQFLKLVPEGTTIAEYDLAIWTAYRKAN